MSEGLLVVVDYTHHPTPGVTVYFHGTGLQIRDTWIHWMGSVCPLDQDQSFRDTQQSCWNTTKSFFCRLQPNNYKFYSCFMMNSCLPSIHLSGVFHHRSQCLIPGVHVSPAPCAAMWQDGRVSHGPTASAWSGQSVTAACSLAAWYLAQYQLNQRKCENHIVLEILCSVQCDTDTDILVPSYTVTRNTYTIMLHQLINLW